MGRQQPQVCKNWSGKQRSCYDWQVLSTNTELETMMLILETPFTSTNWVPAADVERGFVRYRNPSRSNGWVWKGSVSESPPALSVIIPTADADRSGYFAQLMKQIGQQDFQNFELIVVRGDSRQGRAINIGAALASGLYLLTLDDDTALPDPLTFTKLVAMMNDHPDIGMAGGNNVIPQDASPFVQKVMRQIPRRSWEPVSTITDSDLAEHPCLMMRTAEFKSVGGENELIPRGLDPYLRQVFRETELRVVVVPDIIYHHLPPASWSSLLWQFYRNGIQAAWVNRHFPQWVIQTPSAHGEFNTTISLWQRIKQNIFQVAGSLLKGHSIWFWCQISYVAGFLVGLIVQSGEKPPHVEPSGVNR